MVTIKELQRLIPGIEDVDLHNIAEWERDAVAYLETYTRYYFGPRQEHTEYLTGHGGSKLYLLHMAADGSLDDYEFDTLITCDGRACGGDPFEDITDFDVRVVEGESYLIRWGSAVWARGSEYRVTYTRGYEPGREPGDIRGIVIKMVKRAFDAMTSDANLRSESIGGYSYTFSSSDFDADDLKILEPWVRPVVA